MIDVDHGKWEVTVHESVVKEVIKRDPGIGAQVREGANDLAASARSIYFAQQRGTTTYGDDRGATPGVQYEDSFSVETGRDNESYVVNRDEPVASWVESGARARGKTPVLGYAPMRRALDSATTQIGLWR